MTSDDWDDERWLGMARNGQARLGMSGMTRMPRKSKDD